MDITVAREIITRAKKDDIYEGEMPEDDATAISEAEDLVKLAEDAWAKHIRGPEVEAILKLAAGAQNGGDPESDDEPESETPSDEHASPESDEGEKRVLKVVERLSKMEPWEGYGDATVKDVSDGINYFAEDSPNEILDILEHAFSFESTHKSRTRILLHIRDMWQRSGGVIEDQEEQEGQEGPDSSGDTESTEALAEDAPESDDGEGEGVPRASEGEGQTPDAEAHAELEVGETSGEGKADEGKSSGENSEGGSSGGASAYQKLIQGVEAELRRERLDIPKPPEEKAPELPWSWHGISNEDLQDLHMRYAVLAYYKGYRLALHERIAQHCKEAADALHSARMVDVDKYDEKGKEKKVGLIEAEIALDPNVKKWRVLQRKHEQLAAADKREMEAYYKIVEHLSRLETMRHNAWERGRR